MADLKPIGSEKLTGQEKIKRIMEIAMYKETLPVRVNENSTKEFSVGFSDGNEYQIVKEKMGYIIKKTISESETDYIEPMKNRKYFSSYSQALKKLNLMAKEINRLNENEEGISLFGEQKKFVLKTPKAPQPEVDDMPPPPPAEPPAVPSPELPASPDAAPDTAPEGDMDMGSETPGDEAPTGDEMGGDMEDEAPSPESGEEVTFKMIQKLTGKLTQKIREYESEKGLTSENIKYVINMVLSSLELDNLSEEDKEDVLSKFEEDEEKDMGEFGSDEEGGEDEDITSDTDVEDVQADMDVPVEGEVGEGNKFGTFGSMGHWYDENDRPYKGDFDFDYDEEEFDEFDPMFQKHGKDTNWYEPEMGKGMFNKYKEKFGPMKIRTRKPSSDEVKKTGNGAILDSIFGESKIDKVISKYFELTESEVRESKEKKVNKEIEKKSKLKKKMESVKKLSETIEQELSSQKFLEENADFTFLGKTNKNNLVFEGETGQVKITPEGLVI